MAGFLSALFGSKPTVPDLPSLSLPQEQQKALAANIAAIPGAETIATNVDLFNQRQVDQMLSHVIPNYQAIQGNINKNIQSLTAGQIPSDVAAQVQQSDAARSLTGGFGGTEAGGNLVARDLGLTSLDLTQRGLASAQSWLQTANSLYAPGRFNVSSMFLTPGQQASFDVEERNAQFQRNWMQNQIKAMPDPTTVGLWNASWSVVDAVLSAYTGSSVDLGRINPQGTTAQTSGMSLGGGNNNFGGGYSPGAGEGGAGFDNESVGFSDAAAGGGMDMGDMGGGMGGGFGGFV